MNDKIYKLTIRMKEKDYRHLEKEVKRTGLSKQSYFLKLLWGIQPRETPPADFLSILTALNRIGNNLNQIAFKANAAGLIDAADYRENVRWLRSVVGKLTEVMY